MLAPFFVFFKGELNAIAETTSYEVTLAFIFLGLLITVRPEGRRRWAF